MSDKPFAPHFGTNNAQTLAAATPAPFNIEQGDSAVRVWNSGATNKLYFCTYSSKATARVASVTDYPVPPGVVSIVSKPLDHDKISLVSTVGTTVEFMTGKEGI